MADDPNAARRRASRRDRDPDAGGAQDAPPEADAEAVREDAPAAADAASTAAESADEAAPPTEPRATAEPETTGELEPEATVEFEPEATAETQTVATTETEEAAGSAEGDEGAAGASDHAEPTDHAEPADHAESADEAEPADHAEPTDHAESADEAGSPEGGVASAPAESEGVEPASGPEPETVDRDDLVPAAAAAASTLWESPDGTPTASLPWLQARSPDDRICPFLRAVAADDHLGFPAESPDAANRCASMHEAVPQSLRQQELVCLTANHVNCPRYLRGAAETATEVPVARVRPKAVMTPAISAALIILALSFGASVAFGLANGGLAMPSRAAVATPSASATSVAAEATASPSTSSSAPSAAAASPSLRPTAAPSVTPAPTPAPSATPVPSPSPSTPAAPTPAPTSNRFKLLKPCPNKPNCWIYTVRSGDNLYSIAKYFGVPLSTVQRLNPWTKTESLRAGKKLILPTPTR